MLQKQVTVTAKMVFGASINIFLVCIICMYVLSQALSTVPITRAKTAGYATTHRPAYIVSVQDSSLEITANVCGYDSVSSLILKLST